MFSKIRRFELVTRHLRKRHLRKRHLRTKHLRAIRKKYHWGKAVIIEKRMRSFFHRCLSSLFTFSLSFTILPLLSAFEGMTDNGDLVEQQKRIIQGLQLTPTHNRSVARPAQLRRAVERHARVDLSGCMSGREDEGRVGELGRDMPTLVATPPNARLALLFEMTPRHADAPLGGRQEEEREAVRRTLTSTRNGRVVTIGAYQMIKASANAFFNIAFKAKPSVDRLTQYSR
jgi:hypothetical protein